MSKYKKFSKEEKTAWLVVAIVFTFFFTIHIVYGFFTKCIFEWPIRWDVKVCLIEQKVNAVQKASEKAVNFIP